MYYRKHISVTITHAHLGNTKMHRHFLIDNNFNIGDTVKVHFNIKGTRWEKNGNVNYITNLDAWRIEQVSMQQEAASPIGQSAPSADFQADVSDDLPF